MAETRVLTIEVDATLAAMVDDLVGLGRFSDESEIVRCALLLLGEQEKDHGQLWNATVERHGIDRLRALYDEGLAGEPISGNFDPEDIKRRGRERLARRHAA